MNSIKIKFYIIPSLMTILISTLFSSLYFNHIFSDKFDKTLLLANQQKDQKLKILENKQKQESYFIPEKKEILEEPTIDQPISASISATNTTPSGISTPAKRDCSAYERPWREITDLITCDFRLTKAVGNMKVLIVEMLSPKVDLNNPVDKKSMDILNSDQNIVEYKEGNNPTMMKYPSFNYVKRFYEQQAGVFNAGLTLTIEKTKPVVIDDYPDFSASSDKVASSRSYFTKKLSEMNLDLKQYDVINIAAISPDFHEFASSALRYSRITITKINSRSFDSDKNTDTSYLPTREDIETMAHEMGHVFQANDQYNGFACNVPADEYTDNNKIMSLMCGHSQYFRPELGVCGEGSNQCYAAFNKKSAIEMGWVK